MTPQIEHVREAYDTKFSGDGFRNSASYYRWVLEVLAPNPNSTLLDIACGMGDLLLQACERRLRCHGVDLSSVAIALCRAKVPGASLSVARAEQLPFEDAAFDYVTILGSLEHLLDPGEGLLEIRRVLRWGGRAAILVPNSYYLPDIVWQVLRTGYGPSHKQVVERFATCQEWRNFIESGGLKVCRILRYNYQVPRCRDDILWYRENLKRLLGMMVGPFLPLNLSHSFLYVCEKAPETRGQRFRPPYWPAPPRLSALNGEASVR